MLMTHEEIKTALLEGKILYRNKKGNTRVEYKAQGNKFLRRETLPGQKPGEWTNSDIRTASKYEWNIIENQEETKMKQEEPTTDVIRQVPLGDGTTTVITEKVPVSEAPVVIDPFAIPLIKDNDTPEPVEVDVAEHIPEVEEEEEEEEEETRMPFTLSPMLAITEMRTGHQVLWVPLKEDHDLQVMYYRDTDGKFKEIRANSMHAYEEIDMNEFFQHVFVRVEEDYDTFVHCLSYISNQTVPCYMRNIVTGRIIRSPACEYDSDEEKPLEVGTILPIELKTFWVIDFGEVE